MDLKLKKNRLFMVIPFFLSLAALFCLSAHYSTSRSTEIQTVHIIGVYSVDSGAANELHEGENIDSAALHTVVISGHFSEDIPQNCALAFPLNNIRVTVRLNGEEIYCFGQLESIPGFTKTSGSTWGFIESPGITAEDQVEITLENIYTGTVTNVFEVFLKNMVWGKSSGLYQAMLYVKLPNMLFGFVIAVAGLLSLLVFATEKLFKLPGRESGIALSVMTVTGGIWIYIDGGYPYASLLFNNPLLFNTIDILLIILIPLVFIFFVCSCLQERRLKVFALTLKYITLSLVTAAILLQIAGLCDLYELQNKFAVLSFFIITSAVTLMSIESFVCKNKRTLLVLLLFLPLLVTGLLEGINYYARFMPERMAVKYGFAVSIALQFIQLVVNIRANALEKQRSMELEYEQLQGRMAVMLSQIKPHFLINTLNDIRVLYQSSPERAENSLVNFTRYLRENMDSLSQTGLIPFEQELRHVENYLSIEKMRFGNRLKTGIELGCTGFSLPVLSVQPLVENAIRHGVMQKPNGGTVTLRTWEDSAWYHIEISDDGIGFDLKSSASDGRSHMGIQNVKLRLKEMCGGQLEIRSLPGSGTTATIRIPKGDGK